MSKPRAPHSALPVNPARSARRSTGSSSAAAFLASQAARQTTGASSPGETSSRRHLPGDVRLLRDALQSRILVEIFRDAMEKISPDSLSTRTTARTAPDFVLKGGLAMRAAHGSNPGCVLQGHAGGLRRDAREVPGVPQAARSLLRRAARPDHLVPRHREHLRRLHGVGQALKRVRSVQRHGRIAPARPDAEMPDRTGSGINCRIFQPVIGGSTYVSSRTVATTARRAASPPTTLNMNLEVTS